MLISLDANLKFYGKKCKFLWMQIPNSMEKMQISLDANSKFFGSKLLFIRMRIPYSLEDDPQFNLFERVRNNGKKRLDGSMKL